jgi:regulator of replication initiation timing
MSELKEKIDQLKIEIGATKSQIENFEIDPDDFIDQYEESLNDDGAVKVCGLTFWPADIIKEMDPTAYRCGLNDYVDGTDKSDIKEFQDLEEELANLQSELDELEKKLGREYEDSEKLNVLKKHAQKELDEINKRKLSTPHNETRIKVLTLVLESERFAGLPIESFPDEVIEEIQNLPFLKVKRRLNHEKF